MTRLTSRQVTAINGNLAAHDAYLRPRTGIYLKELACRAAGIEEKRLAQAAAASLIAVIPISSGLGVIPGFCDAVAHIAAHLGCKTLRTEQTDVAGLAEAFQSKARVLVLADDHFFVAIHHAGHQITDNAVATAKGFVTGLACMIRGGLAGRNVLVIGCGNVGQAAANVCVAMQANVSVYDINHDSYDMKACRRAGAHRTGGV